MCVCVYACVCGGCVHACVHVFTHAYLHACALIVLCTWVVLYAQTVVLCVELIQCSIVSSCTSLFIRGFILVCDVSLLAHV